MSVSGALCVGIYSETETGYSLVLLKEHISSLKRLESLAPKLPVAVFQDPCSQGRRFPSVRVVNNYATVVIMVLQQYILLFLLLKCISDGYLVLDKTEESIRNVPFSASAGEAELPASLGLHLSMLIVQVQDQRCLFLH